MPPTGPPTGPPAIPKAAQIAQKQGQATLIWAVGAFVNCSVFLGSHS